MLRLCEVEGRKAIWHAWVDDYKFIIHGDEYIAANQKYRLNEFLNVPYINDRCEKLEKVKIPVGLVEFIDTGEMAKVEPVKIKFANSYEVFKEIVNAK